jgi:hypothetical protein
LGDPDEGTKDEDEEEEVIGLWQSMTHPDYRMATWVVVGVATANQMAGINVINMFSTDIFTKMEASGIPMGLDTKTSNYFIGGAGFTGACLANLTVNFLSRRMLLIGGHFFIMIGLFLIFLFQQL